LLPAAVGVPPQAFITIHRAAMTRDKTKTEQRNLIIF
jgi:hypothetical protein